jgi:hypothetical protein
MTDLIFLVHSRDLAISLEPTAEIVEEKLRSATPRSVESIGTGGMDAEPQAAGQSSAVSSHLNWA